MRQPILSICIPTYNRDKYLRSALLSIFSQIKFDDQDVEVVVSDNHSTDNTPEVVKEFAKHPNFIYHRNEANLGFVKNIVNLPKVYASGKYCWVIGDDDFILPGAIDAIVSLLKEEEADFYYVKTKLFHVSDYDTYDAPFKSADYQSALIDSVDYKRVGKFQNLISPDYSIIFLGEIMAGIFRRSIWNTFEGSLEGENFSSVMTTYPHCVIYAEKFFDKQAIYIGTESILTLEGAREWWEKLGYVYLVHVKGMLDLYKQKGLSNDILAKCYTHFIKMSLPSFAKFLINKNAKYRQDVSLSKYFRFLVTHPLQLVNAVTDFVGRRVGLKSSKP